MIDISVNEGAAAGDKVRDYKNNVVAFPTAAMREKDELSKIEKRYIKARNSGDPEAVAAAIGRLVEIALTSKRAEAREKATMLLRVNCKVRITRDAPATLQVVAA